MKSLIRGIVLSLALVLVLSGCSKAPTAGLENGGITETGKMIDITTLDQQDVDVKVGDVLYLKLTGEANSGRQWTVTSPTGGEYLILKDHQVIGLMDPDALDGQFTDEWWMLVAKSGSFVLGFDYGILGQLPENTFEVTINSGK